MDSYGTERLNVKVFLSHRYRSPRVNLRFFEVISDVAEVQFEVDPGLRATSTTRLERMIRDADMFIGIHSVDDDPFRTLEPEQLTRSASYLRLELDMAVRVNLPAVAFIDRRYGRELEPAPPVAHFRYAPQEILSRDAQSARRRARSDFANFCRSAQDVIACRPRRLDADRVGILVPPRPAGEPDLAGHLVGLVESFTHSPLRLPWPPAMDGQFMTHLRQCDWVMVEMADWRSASAVAFLRGQGVPLLRLRREGSASPSEPETDAVLYGNLAHHYAKDVIRWRNPDELDTTLGQRIQHIYSEPHLIDNASLARSYFESAAKLPHIVFLSYAKGDKHHADLLGAELRRYFQEVFDYRTPDSIPHGVEWLDSMLASLARAAVGVPILSPRYARSRYCMEEGRRMMDRMLSGEMRVFPVLLEDTSIDLFNQLEYRRLSRSSPAEIVAGIVAGMRAPDSVPNGVATP